MSNEVILLCGVPGSGKTWIMDQLQDKFWCVPNDDYIGLPRARTAKILEGWKSPLPLLIDCPFGERVLREEIEALGFHVTPMFVIESPAVIARRYEAREGKLPTQAMLTRAETIKLRCAEWDGQGGTSKEVYEILREY